MKSPRLAAHLLLALAALAADAARAASCAAPEWYRKRQALSLQDELLGFGKGPDVEGAFRDARRSIAAKLAPKHAKELLSLPDVKSGISYNVYSRADVLKALPHAFAYGMSSLRRVRAESVCGTTYAAFAITEQKALDDVRGQPDFVGHVNASLTKKGIDKLEDERALSARQVTVTETSNDLGPPLATLAKLDAFARTIDATDFYERHWGKTLRQRVEKVRSAIEDAQAAEWPEERTQPLRNAAAATVQAKRYAAAIHEWRKKDYVAAFSAFNTLASEGDPGAQFVVGMMYYEAKGVKRSYPDALAFLKRASAKGNSPAKAIIGMMYFAGMGVKSDFKEAFKWLEAGIDAGWRCEVEVKACQEISR